MPDYDAPYGTDQGWGNPLPRARDEDGFFIAGEDDSEDIEPPDDDLESTEDDQDENDADDDQD